MSGRRRLAGAILLGLARVAVSEPARASAEEPRAPGEPVLMREPGEPLMIPDAADGEDVIDFDLGLSYRFELELATLVQGDASRGDLTHLSSTLVPEARIGMFHDLAGIIRLPILLAETRELSPEGRGDMQVMSGGETLFTMPLDTPARSGLLAVTTGVHLGVMNQARSPDLPTWNVGLLLDVSAGDAIHACTRGAPSEQIACADPFDQDRDGERDPGEPALAKELDAGLTRESVTLRAETALSRRIRYVEPFLILDVAVELPLEESPLRRGGDFALPPVRASLEVGAGLVPWENRERHSRVWLDLRARATLVSAGPDITPLFDALGSSDAPSVRAVTTQGGASYAVNGVTERALHGAFAAESSFVWRASQLIRLGLDVDLAYMTAHDLAVPCEDDACAALDREVLHEGGALGLADHLTIGFGANGAVTF